jgi:UrcA family protein
MNINTNNRTRIVAAVALFAALTAGAQAADIPQVHVKYADLNVGTTAGATMLYRRIRGAADRVCGVADKRDLARLGQAKACADHAVAEAVAKVNAPALTQVYEFQGDIVPVTRLAAIR